MWSNNVRIKKIISVSKHVRAGQKPPLPGYVRVMAVMETRDGRSFTRHMNVKQDVCNTYLSR